MSSHTGLTARGRAGAPAPEEDPASSGRLSVDIRRFPWIRRLACDYAFEYRRLADFFSGNPADLASWHGALARAAAQARPSRTLVDVLQAQQRRRSAPPESVTALGRLADPGAVAIVTGQQAGLFGGPLFTLLKALTAVLLADRVSAEHQVTAVPVFWVDAEDHDWDEVKSCGVLDADLVPRSLSAGDPPGAHDRPVGHVYLDDAVTSALSDLEAALSACEFSAPLLDDLRRIYRPGAGMAEAFSQWLERVLGPHGLVVFDASDAAVKPLLAGLFAREVEQAGTTSQLASSAGAALTALGYHAQVTPQEDSVALFHLNTGRQPIRIVGNGFRIGDNVQSKAWLLERIERHPDEFSPSVLLRPVVQDSLFPTACYVAGPSELAYLAQLRGVYDAFAVPMPLILPRATATLVDGNAMRFLTRQAVALEALRPQDESALNALLLAQLPASVERSIREAGDLLDRHMDTVAREVSLVDATLEGAARSTLGRMQDDLKKLHGKVVQAAKRKDETLRRQFRHAQAQAFPNGQPQEREIGFVYFLARYGPGVIDHLRHTIAPDPGTHWVIAV